MHRISIRPPPPSASGCRSRSKRRGRRASAPGPDASPCAAALVATLRLRERSPRVGAAVSARSGEAGCRAEAGRQGGAREGAGGVTVTVDAWSRAKHASCLLVLSLSHRCNRRDGRGYRNKKTSGRRGLVYWTSMQAYDGASGRMDALHVAF